MADDPLAGAAQALNDFASGPVAEATATIEAAVAKSFDAVSATIARAALSGKTSMDQLVAAILADFDRIAVARFIEKPLDNLLSSLAESVLPVSGARALGGPVAAGETYLVGERGPELFTPAANGTIVANTALAPQRPSVVVNVATPDVQGFFRSRSQIAALMGRALARGQRNL
jgi:phage-related minor tail protein